MLPNLRIFCKTLLCLLIKTCSKDSDDDILRRAFAQTGEYRHNVDVKLEGRLIVPPDLVQLLTCAPCSQGTWHRVLTAFRIVADGAIFSSSICIEIKSARKVSL